MKKAKILIVEDESIVALDIKICLEEYDYEVIAIAKNHNKALEILENNKIDIVLMDINLKGSLDGIETAKLIKDKYEIALIYLSALSNEATIERAIETNPIAYIVKPFKAEELNATMKLALYKLYKPIKKVENKLFNLGQDYFFDLLNEQLFYNEHPIKLSKNEKHLLKLLIEAKGNSISYNDIEYNIWPDTIVNNDSLRSLVYRLRTKLNYKCIETVPAYGYKLNSKY